MSDLIERNNKALEGRQPGDIIFFHPVAFNPFAFLILFVTGEHYDHGAIVVDGNKIIEADPYVGVHHADITSYMNSYTLDLFRLKENHDGKKIVECAEKYLGWSYSYSSVFWAGIGYILLRLTGIALFRKIKNPDDDDQAVDSEQYIDLVYKNYGVNLNPNLPPSNVSAQTLADSPLLFKVNF